MLYKSMRYWSKLPWRESSKILGSQCCYSTKSSGVLLSHKVFEPSEGGSKDVPLLITHGLLGSKQNWNSIAKAIAKSQSRKVVTFDARDHGDSPHTDQLNYKVMADDILMLTKHLHLPRFMLLGHSMGGRTVMTFALKHPEMVERLIVVDVSPLEQSADFPSMRVFVHTLQELNTMLTAMGNERSVSEVRKSADDALKGVAIDPAVRAFLLTNLASKDGKVYWKPNFTTILKDFEEIGKFPEKLLEKTFDKPSLFIRGQKSLYIPLSDFTNIQKTFTNSHLATVENAGHWPHSENTIRFMEILLPFLSGQVVD